MMNMLLIIVFVLFISSNVALTPNGAVPKDFIYSLDGCKTPFDSPSLQETHREIRSKFIAQWFRSVGSNAVIYLQGKTTANREGTDTEVQFRQESNFLYFTGVQWPDFSLVINITDSEATSKAILFAPKRDDFWAIWNGVIETIEELREKFGIPDVLYDTELESQLKELTQNGKTIYTLPEVVLPGFPVNDKVLLPIIYSCRVTKTKNELIYMEIAANVSSDAHIAVMKDSKAGLYEFNFASYFHYYCMSCGLLHQSYLPITAYGKHSAILHYNVPLAKVENTGLMLIDAGGEYTYGTDITRTFPVSGKYSPHQKLIYNLVLSVVLQIEQELKPGKRWSQISLMAQELITRGLLENNFIQGNYDDLMANRIFYYFYPHGLGHSVGIDVHDPGSIEIIVPNIVLTVEPGIYFNEVLLAQGFEDFGRFFNIPLCLEYLTENFGGVRIEDTVRITEDGIKVLSYVPKTVEEIEKIMEK